jgi:nucleoside-diphosphate-sugar epimerase
MERVLVTGASGFVGARLVATLAAQGVPVVALHRRETDARRYPPSVAVMIADLRDEAACGRLLDGVDTVFHLAAVRDRPGTSPQAFTSVNETATLRLLRQGVAARIDRFVHVASAQIYGPSSVPLDETAPLRTETPASLYAASRARAVLGIRELTRAGAPVVTLAPTLVYGPDRPGHRNRVTAYARRILAWGFDVVLDGGVACRNLVHVDDLIAALLAAARAPGVEGEEFLIGGETISQRDLGALVRRCAGRRRPVRLSCPAGLARGLALPVDTALRYDARAGWASAVETLRRSWTFDDSKGRSALGHRPRSLAEGIAQIVAWLEHGEGR